jgi:hypothetical protein
MLPLPSLTRILFFVFISILPFPVVPLCRVEPPKPLRASTEGYSSRH